MPIFLCNQEDIYHFIQFLKVLIDLPMAANKKTEHAVNVLESLQKLREEGFNCDFIIKVGSESFKVHRNILAACSDYFKAMFSHSTKEVEEGFVDMKDVEEEGVKQCVEFMYKGEANITLDNAQHVLHTAAMMQLKLLTEHCFEVLLESLNEENCFDIKHLAEMYTSEKAKEFVDNFLLINLEKLLPCEGFLRLDRSDLIDIVKNEAEISNEVRWKALASWVKHDEEHRKEYFFELVKLMNFEKFTFNFLLSTVWGDPLVQESDDCKHLVVVYLFSDSDQLSTYLNAQNCFLLKEIATNFRIEDPKIMIAIDDFMKQSFEQIANESKFETMGREDVLHLFQVVKSSHWHQVHTDIIKWKAAVKWIKQDPENKKAFFPELLKCIKFEWFPLNYIKNNVRAEPLVKESHECKDLLLDVLCDKVNKLSDKHLEGASFLGSIKPRPTVESAHIVAILDRRHKELRGFDIENQEWHKIADAPQVTNNGFSYVVNVDNTLYLINNKSLYQLLHNATWLRKADMDFKHDRSTKVVAFRDRIYVISCTILADYNTATDIWTELIQPDNFRSGFCLAAAENHIYAIGGFPYTDQVRRYAPEIMSWMQCSPMTNARSNACAEFISPYIYVMGGRRDEMILNSFERYHIDHQQWTVLLTMQLPRSNFASCVLEENLYAVGGHGSIEYYDDRTKEWELLSGIGIRPFGLSACGLSCWMVTHPCQNLLGDSHKIIILP